MTAGKFVFVCAALAAIGCVSDDVDVGGEVDLVEFDARFIDEPDTTFGCLAVELTAHEAVEATALVSGGWREQVVSLTVTPQDGRYWMVNDKLCPFYADQDYGLSVLILGQNERVSEFHLRLERGVVRQFRHGMELTD